MRLGVGVTYFNERELFTECLESLLAQAPDEILVFDDASGFPAKPYVPAGAPIRIIRSDSNVGPSKGRNRLLKEFQSDYVHFHDADDLFLPGWTDAIRSAMKQSLPDLILTEVTSTKDGALYAKKVLELEELEKNADLVRFTLRHPVLPAAATYRKSFLKAAGGYLEDLWQSEDYELHIRLAALGATYRLVPEPMALLRVRSESRSQRLREVWDCRLAGLRTVAPYLGRGYDQELGEAFAQVGSQLFRLGDRLGARQAFSLASERQARFSDQQPLYRLAARLWGPMLTERLAAAYREIIPPSLRQLLRSAVIASPAKQTP